MPKFNRIKIYALLLSCLCCLPLFANHKQSTYQRWMEMPSDILLRLGDQYHHDANYDSAMVCYTIIANRYGKDMPRNEKATILRALNELGVLNTSCFSNYTAAYKNLISAYEICQEIHDERMEPYILLNLGNLYNLYEFFCPTDDEPTQARQYYERSFRSACRTGEWSMAISSYINFAMFEMPYSVGPDSVHHEMRQWLHDSIPHDIPDWNFTNHFLEGAIALMEGQFDQAITDFSLMENEIESNPDQVRMQYMVLTCISAVHVKQGDYNSAISCAKKILMLDGVQDMADIQIETYRFLSEYYSHLGDKAQADHYRMAFLEKKEEMTKSIIGLLPTQLSHDLQEVSDKMAKMKEQKRRNNIILIAALVLMGLLAIFSFFIKRKNKELALKNEALYNRMTEIIHFNEQNDALKNVEKYKDSTLNEEKSLLLVEKIKSVMADSAIICQPSFTLRDLAQLLDSNTSYLSRAINENFGMTFTHLLNQYRVKEACRRMEDKEHYGNLTIDAISESVGFKARVTFTKAFKQHVGMLPSEYLKAVNTHQNEIQQTATEDINTDQHPD